MGKWLFGKWIVMVALTAGVLLSTAAGLRARPVAVYSIKRIVDESDLVVIGHVTGIESAEAAKSDEDHWHCHLLEMRATVRVLRSYGKTGIAGPANSSDVVIKYLALDPKNPALMINGPMFPQVDIGDVYAFPLKNSSSASDTAWALIHEEDFGLLVPCVTEAPPVSEDRVEQLWSELARTFARGSYKDVYKAACYLRNSFAYPDPGFDYFLKELEDRIGKDEERWLEVGVATYCSLGYPRPDIAELPSKKPSEQTILAARAFGHVDPKGIAGRIVTESIAHIDVHSSATANLISQNYRDHPLAIKLITSALEQGDPNAIDVAYDLARKKSSPLIPAAVRASVKFLGTPWNTGETGGNYGHVRGAGLLIAQFGNREDFAFLLGQIREARKDDIKRYTTLWVVLDEDYARIPEVCRAVIDDKRQIYKDDRFCDRAVWALARVTKTDFGIKAGRTPDGGLAQSESERDKCVEKAKAWLKRNAPEAR